MQFLSVKKTCPKITNLVLFVFLAVHFSACDNATDAVPQSNEVSWKTSSSVGATQGSSAIIIEGVEGLNWSAEIIEGADWCSFSSLDPTNTFKTGKVASDLNILYVYYTANLTTDQRRAKISFRFGGEDEYVLDLVQQVQSQGNYPAFNSWAEIPSYQENPNYQYVTHATTLNSRSVRNFSFCLDKTKKVALWVAYPIHSSYLGSGGRTDAWAFDPLVKTGDQANCVSYSYRGQYDRGHQIASADRLATVEMNAQTFYMSNITPQLDRLNQDMWARLEAKVRSYKCSDTLYVVTGAYFSKDAVSTTSDGYGNTVPIPSNYFKVLLRTKSGSTGKEIADCEDSELITIGFWVEHKSYGDIEPPRSVCTSVSQIEEKTGFAFFPQVSAVVKQQNNPAQWGL